MSKFFDLPLFRKITSTSPKKIKDTVEREKQMQLASCAVLVEMAKSDDDFSDDEKSRIIQILQRTFKLDEFEAEDLMFLSAQKFGEVDAIETFADYIDTNYDNDEKYELVKDVWRIVYSDDDLHTREQEMIRKITSLLKLDNRMINNAKDEIRREMGLYI